MITDSNTYDVNIQKFILLFEKRTKRERERKKSTGGLIFVCIETYQVERMFEQTPTEVLLPPRYYLPEPDTTTDFKFAGAVKTVI